MPASQVLWWRRPQRRLDPFTGQLTHALTVPAGPGGRPGERFRSPSTSPYLGVVTEEGGRNDACVRVGRHGSRLLIVCFGTVQAKGTPEQQAQFGIDRLDGTRRRLLTPARSEVLLGQPAVRYDVQMPRGVLAEWRLERSGWLFGIGLLRFPADDAQQVQRLTAQLLETWEWLEDTTAYLDLDC